MVLERATVPILGLTLLLGCSGEWPSTEMDGAAADMDGGPAIASAEAAETGCRSEHLEMPAASRPLDVVWSGDPERLEGVAEALAPDLTSEGLDVRWLTTGTPERPAFEDLAVHWDRFGPLLREEATVMFVVAAGEARDAPPAWFDVHAVDLLGRGYAFASLPEEGAVEDLARALATRLRAEAPLGCAFTLPASRSLPGARIRWPSGERIPALGGPDACDGTGGYYPERDPVTGRGSVRLCPTSCVEAAIAGATALELVPEGC